MAETKKFLHKLQEKREEYWEKHPWWYGLFGILFLLACITTHHFYEKWLDSLQFVGIGGRIMSFVLYIGWFVFILVAIILFRLDFGRSRKHQIPMSWEPWVLVLVLGIILIGDFAKIASGTNVTGVNRPAFDLYLNKQYLTNGSVVTLEPDRKLFFMVYNVGGEFATNLFFDFFAPFDRSNFIYDTHWKIQDYHPIPINHKMYSRAGTTGLLLPAQQPLSNVSPNNAFDVTAFSIAPSFIPIKNPVEKMEQFGMMLDSSLESPRGDFMPVWVQISSIGSLTNQCYIFLKF